MPLENLEALRDAFGRHHLAPRRRGVDVAMAALLVAQLGYVDLQRVDGTRRQLDPGPLQPGMEVVPRRRRRRPEPDHRAQSTSFLRWFSICTECTSVIPACITAATCTASIIWSGFAPVSRHCVVYASMQ